MPSVAMLSFTATIGTRLIIFDCAVNARLDLTPPPQCGESHNPESYCALGKDNPRCRSRATHARGMSISLSLRAGGSCDVSAPSVASVGQPLNSARGSGERRFLFPSSAALRRYRKSASLRPIRCGEKGRGMRSSCSIVFGLPLSQEGIA